MTARSHSLKRLHADLEQAQQEEKAAEELCRQKRHRRLYLQTELANHPTEKARRAKEEQDELRRNLPSFLYQMLVEKPVKGNRRENLGRLQHFSMQPTSGFDDDGDAISMVVITLSFEHHRCHYDIRTKQGRLVEKPSGWFEEPKQWTRDIETLWADAMALNENYAPDALAAIMACTARYLDDSDPCSDFLFRAFEDKEEDEESD